MSTVYPESQPIRLAELLAALSLATDLAMNFPPETAIRTCLLAISVGHDLGLSDEQLSDVFYISLLRHIGCTAFSHEEGAELGDDNAFRSNFTGIDDRRATEVAGAALRTVGAIRGPIGRLRVVSAFALEFGPSAKHRILTAHCDASRQLARQLGMTAGVVSGLDHIFERWDGKGHLELKGDAISLPARITHLSHSVVLEQWRSGDSAARAMVRRRSGGEFDPVAAEIFLRRSGELLEQITPVSVWDTALDAEPSSRPWLPPSRLEQLVEAIALFADMKSAYTIGHSQSVARLVDDAAREVNLAAPEISRLRRAALLHNVGRLAVTSGIWGKSGRLNPAEWERVRLYPYHTERIVTRAAALKPVALLSGSVQERIDGSGYHRGLVAGMLSTSARLLAAADVYQALNEERPHRPALEPVVAARTLLAEADAGRLDRDAVAAVLEGAGHPKPRTTRNWPAGLTDREIDVLRKVAQAKPNKAIASELVISEETVRNHIRHIYEKIGVSSRAGAALFAMENDLIRR